MVIIEAMVFCITTLCIDIVAETEGHVASIFTLKVEAALPSEALVSCHSTTQCHNEDDHELNLTMFFMY
jgi:hypothetical protein